MLLHGACVWVDMTFEAEYALPLDMLDCLTPVLGFVICFLARLLEAFVTTKIRFPNAGRFLLQYLLY